MWANLQTEVSQSPEARQNQAMGPQEMPMISMKAPHIVGDSDGDSAAVMSSSDAHGTYPAQGRSQVQIQKFRRDCHSTCEPERLSARALDRDRLMQLLYRTAVAFRRTSVLYSTSRWLVR